MVSDRKMFGNGEFGVLWKQALFSLEGSNYEYNWYRYVLKFELVTWRNRGGSGNYFTTTLCNTCHVL
jgi:hypothetical protein